MDTTQGVKIAKLLAALGALGGGGFLLLKSIGSDIPSPDIKQIQATVIEHQRHLPHHITVVVNPRVGFWEGAPTSSPEELALRAYPGFTKVVGAPKALEKGRYEVILER